MNKKTSWKILLPSGLLLWVAGGQIQNVIFAGVIAFVGFVLIIVALIRLAQSFKKSPTNTSTSPIAENQTISK